MRCHPSSIGFTARSIGAMQKCAVALGLMLSFSIVPLPAHAANVISVRSLRIRPVMPKHAAPRLLPVVDQKDILEHHRILADQVLRALPSSCRDHLKNFYVTYEQNPRSRGLGGESTMIVTGNVPDKEFMALVVHECGHVTDLGGLLGTETADRTMFADGSVPIYRDDPSMTFYDISWLSPVMMQPNMTDNDFVSGYAKSDPFEDFAETFAYYVLQQKEFARIARGHPVLQAKYDFMANIVFAGSPKIAEGKSTRGTRAPWDVTKLPYVWHAKR